MHYQWRSGYKKSALFGFVATLAAVSSAQMRITEWMYSGNDGEYMEFTNVGGGSIDMTGWSFDDSSETPGSQDLSAFGSVGAHESVVLCEPDAATFASSWSLSGVKVIGLNSNNLGRADEINLYDAGDALVDRLTYDDQSLGGPRTQNISGNIAQAHLGGNDAADAVASVVGDAYGSWTAANGDIGNPGTYPQSVPEPVSMGVLGVGAIAFLAKHKKR